jgi:hypothetical protein
MTRIVLLLPILVFLFKCDPSTSPPANPNPFIGLWKYSKPNSNNSQVYSGTIRFSENEFLANCEYLEYLSQDSTQHLRMKSTYHGTVEFPNHTTEQVFTAPFNSLKLVIDTNNSKDTLWFSGSIQNDTLELSCINEIIPNGFIFPTSTVYLFR